MIGTIEGDPAFHYGLRMTLKATVEVEASSSTYVMSSFTYRYKSIIYISADPVVQQGGARTEMVCSVVCGHKVGYCFFI